MLESEAVQQPNSSVTRAQGGQSVAGSVAGKVSPGILKNKVLCNAFECIFCIAGNLKSGMQCGTKFLRRCLIVPTALTEI